VEGFAESLDLADEVLLLPIYPARELPIEGVTSKLIVDRMTPGKAVVVSKEELLTMVGTRRDLELVITAGAGDIDTLVEPIRKILEKKYK
jgi:UDP-N-acetylmuramate--alanine ligase